MANISIISSALSLSASRLMAASLAGNRPVAERFLSPLANILGELTTTRRCPELPDADWLALGVLRVLHDAPSGRGFLQEVGPGLPGCPEFNHFFATLRSERRLAVCTEADELLRRSLAQSLPDALAEVHELRDFDVYAGDGHWHGAAAHDQRPDLVSPKAACGHFYALDLRRGLLHHITAADQVAREHEHDMRALERQTITSLRRGAKKGRKVLYVWDKAAIKFEAWEKWKRQGAIYFLSQEKENMTLEHARSLAWDPADSRNAGVQSDELVKASRGLLLRRIRYRDPVTQILYSFITSERTIPPGILVELGRRRWDIEKVFDELKNKLGETRAWASDETARSMQAIFITITHQLLAALEHLLEEEHGIRPEAELKRRSKRLAGQIAFAAKKGLAFPSLRSAALRLTQRTVKFLRWLRASLVREAPWLDLIALLRRSYASI